MLDDAPWYGRPGEVDRDQINKLIEYDQHYTMQETQVTYSEYPNKLIGENEKYGFYFMEKTIRIIWPNQ